MAVAGDDHIGVGSQRTLQNTIVVRVFSDSVHTMPQNHSLTQAPQRAQITIQPILIPSEFVTQDAAGFFLDLRCVKDIAEPTIDQLEYTTRQSAKNPSGNNYVNGNHKFHI